MAKIYILYTHLLEFIAISTHVILTFFLVRLKRSEIKLSTLDYALLPTTHVAIHSLDMRLPLEVSFETMDIYPFIKTIRVSLTKIPPCRVRVTPLSQSSGLRGIDLGSLPVLNAWVQDALHDSLEEYLSPSYIAIDIESFWYAEDRESEPDFAEIATIEEEAHPSVLPRQTSAAGKMATQRTPLGKELPLQSFEPLEWRKTNTDGKGNKTTPDSSEKTRKRRYASRLNAIASRIVT